MIITKVNKSTSRDRIDHQRRNVGDGERSSGGGRERVLVLIVLVLDDVVRGEDGEKGVVELRAHHGGEDDGHAERVKLLADCRVSCHGTHD